jgi:hypothetical protein
LYGREQADMPRYSALIALVLETFVFFYSSTFLVPHSFHQFHTVTEIYSVTVLYGLKARTDLQITVVSRFHSTPKEEPLFPFLPSLQFLETLKVAGLASVNATYELYRTKKVCKL